MNQESFSSLPYPLDSDHKTHPLLLLSHGDYLQNQTFYSISKNKAPVDAKIAEFRTKKAISTSHPSWLALIRLGKSSISFSLLNTATKQEIHLPKIKQKPEPNYTDIHYTCTFSETPTNPNCRVLFTALFDSRIHFCRIGDEKFISRPNKYGDDDDDDTLTSPVYCNGKIYAWMSRSSTFVQVDFIGGEITIANKLVRIPNPKPSFLRLYMEHVVESDGEILMVYAYCSHEHTGDICYFIIFNIDPLKGEWSEVKTIGNRTIFLDPYKSKSFLCNTTADDDSVKKNSIYFFGADRILYVYDIDDRSKTIVKLPTIKRNSPWRLSWVLM
ncbi:hypothetical protein ABFS83_12G073700 [Erythranthe nasuta]